MGLNGPILRVVRAGWPARGIAPVNYEGCYVVTPRIVRASTCVPAHLLERRACAALIRALQALKGAALPRLRLG